MFAGSLQRGALAALVVHVSQLGDGNEFAQHLDIGLAVRLLADENLDDLLEVQQPERQVHVGRADDFRKVLEGMGIFAVDIEKQDMPLGVPLQDAAKQQCHGARFAGSGGAEDCEMLAQHLIDLDHGRYGFVLGDVAHADRGVAVIGIGLLELVLRGAEHGIAERWITRNAATELLGFAALVLRQFTEELDLDDAQFRLIRRLPRHRRG